MLGWIAVIKEITKWKLIKQEFEIIRTDLTILYNKTIESEVPFIGQRTHENPQQTANLLIVGYSLGKTF